MSTLNAENIRQVFDYSPETGVLSWRVRPSRGRVSVGDHAGAPLRDGYLSVQYCGVRYLVHRVAWLWMTGDWPAMSVDHINGAKSDNRWENLRHVSHKTNCENRRFLNKNNTSGYLGVSVTKHGFMARIGSGGKFRCLGTFATAELASEAYIAAKRAMHAGCTL